MNLEDACKSPDSPVPFIFLAPLKWYNALEIYRDSALHVKRQITDLEKKFMNNFFNKCFPNKKVTSVSKMSIILRDCF